MEASFLFLKKQLAIFNVYRFLKVFSHVFVRAIHELPLHWKTISRNGIYCFQKVFSHV